MPFPPSRTRTHHLRRAAALVLAGLFTPEVFAGFEAKDTRILDLSWTTPSAPDLGAELATHQHLPLDGVIADLIQNNPVVGNGNPPDLFAWRTWGPAMNAASFSQATASLNSASLGLFKDSLLRFNVAGPQTDWFDSAGVLANAQFASSIMAQGGFKGIFLDTEYYPNVAPGTAFDYNAQPQKASHTFAEYQVKAREVGAQFMQSLKSQNPDVQVMLTFGYKTAGTNQADWPNSGYGLLPAFIDGLLDASGPSNLVIDGFEDAYGYTSTAQYDAAYQTMRVGNSTLSSNPTGFADHHRASFAFWLDRGPDNNSTVWDPVNIENNSYSPAQFQFSVQEAAKRSDKYVWIYSQIASWWDGNIPQPYVDALKSVRKVGSFERFRGTIKDTATWQAQGAGAVIQNNGLFLDTVNFLTASQADYTTKSLKVGIGGLVSVEVRNDTSTANTGLWQFAKLGLILSNDSGGSSASALLDSRALSLLWSNNDNAILAGRSDAGGMNQLTTISSADHPTGTTWIYQIERLSATTAKFTVMDTNGGTIIGVPQIISFSGMPADLSVSLFAQGGDAMFNNVWVAAAVYSGWAKNGSGDWSDANNWSTTQAPNAEDAKVLLGGAISSPRTVYTDAPVVAGTLRFDNPNGYQITGQGSLSMNVSSGTATIVVAQGNHKINLPLFVSDSTLVNIAASSSLKISNPMTLMGGVSFTKTGAGTLSIEAPVFTAAAAEVALGAGVTNISTDLGQAVALSVSGGTTNFTAAQHLASLDVAGGEVAIESTVRTAAVSLTGDGMIDLRAGRLLIDYSGTSPLSDIQHLIAIGALTSSQLGPGLSIGAGEASDLFGSQSGVFAGETIDSSTVVVVMALAADASLDGIVDSADFNLLAAHYGRTSDTRWTRGDFDGDGRIDTSDFNLLAGNFGATLNLTAFGAAVPEPALAGWSIVLLCGVRRSKRK